MPVTPMPELLQYAAPSVRSSRPWAVWVAVTVVLVAPLVALSLLLCL